MTGQPTLRDTPSGLEIQIPGVAHPFQVLSWSPPRLLLCHQGQVRVLFLAPGEDGIWVGSEGQVHFVPDPARQRSAAVEAAGEGDFHDDLTASMPGTVLEVMVKEGDSVTAGQRLLLIEAMKMETPLRAPQDSVVSRIHVQAGDSVAPGMNLIDLEAQA